MDTDPLVRLHVAVYLDAIKSEVSKKIVGVGIDSKIREYKNAIGAHLVEKIEQDCLDDVTIAIAALADVFVTFASLTIGQDRTIEMLLEMSTQMKRTTNDNVGL